MSAVGVQREVDAGQDDDRDQRDRDAQPGPARHGVPHRAGDQRHPDRLGRHDRGGRGDRGVAQARHPGREVQGQQDTGAHGPPQLTSRQSGQLGTPGGQRRRPDRRDREDVAPEGHRQRGRRYRRHQRPGRRHGQDTDAHQERGRPAVGDRPCSAGLLGRSRRPSSGTGPVWDARQVIVDRDAELARALVEEACRKSALVWLRPIGARPQPGGVARLGRRRRARRDGRHRAAAAGPRGRQRGRRHRTQQGHVGPDGRRSAPRSPPWRRATTPGTPSSPSCTPSGSTRRTARRSPRGGPASPGWSGSSRPAISSRRPGTCRTGRTPPSHPGSPATTRGPLPFVVGRRARRRA